MNIMSETETIGTFELVIISTTLYYYDQRVRIN